MTPEEKEKLADNVENAVFGVLALVTVIALGLLGLVIYGAFHFLL